MERTRLNAYAELVDGVVLPAALAGHPALDFCNTLAGWDGVDVGDYLRAYDHLAVFAAAGGLVEPAVVGRLRRRSHRRRTEAAEVLANARRFRADLYSEIVAPHPGSHWDRVAAEVTAAGSVSRLVLHGERAEWVLPERVGLRLPLLAVARSAGDLLVSDDVRAVQACPGRGCGWLFLDRSGRRRWCTMATCGNRAKVRRFAERRRTSAVQGPV